jgi:hypothetical protein
MPNSWRWSNITTLCFLPAVATQYHRLIMQALLDIKDKTSKSVTSAALKLQQASALLNSVLPSSEGQSAESTAAGSESQAGTEGEALGFVPGLNHHLLAPAPPRVVKVWAGCTYQCHEYDRARHGLLFQGTYVALFAHLQAPTQQQAHTSWAAMLQHLQAAVSVQHING